MLAKLGVVKVGVFWKANVDVGPTMRDRSANAEFFARLSALETLFEGMKECSRFTCSWIAGGVVVFRVVILRLNERKGNRRVGA